MSKGRKRTHADYEREIKEAAKRMKKWPEHKRSARDSDTWKEFLQSIGITNSDAGFWQDVRREIKPLRISSIQPLTQRQLNENLVKVIKTYRDEKGHFTSKKTDHPVYSYWNRQSGFVKRINLIGWQEAYNREISKREYKRDIRE